MRAPFLALTLFLCSCRCAPGTMGSDVELTATPASLSFGAVYLGAQRTLPLVLTNRGLGSATFDLQLDAPFSADVTSVHLAGGADQTIALTFTPEGPAVASGELRVGALRVALSGQGLAVPPCDAGPCEASRFDPDAGVCRTTPLPEDAPCTTSCLSAGQCTHGACVGASLDCDDANACTRDLCGAQGCLHDAVSCEDPPEPCRVGSCDPLAGCVTSEAPDGTLCGSDDCLAATVNICIAGACVERARPATGRCTNTWVTADVAGGAFAWDELHHLALVQGVDTWLWNQHAWQRRTPAARPPRRGDAALAWDPLRRRVVLFGGADDTGAPLGDTWEWDGTTWVQRVTAQAPSPRRGAALAFDGRRLVLVGGRGATLSDETWTWDGTRWQQLHPLQPLVARANHGLAFDPVRQRLVAHGGSVFDATFGGEVATDDTWEFDGTTWAPRGAGGPRGATSLAWEPRSRELLGTTYGLGFRATMSWDGARWRTLPDEGPSFGAQLVTDAQGGRVLGLDARLDLWEWADRWRALTHRATPLFTAFSLVDRGTDAAWLFSWDAPGAPLEAWQWLDAGFVPQAPPPQTSLNWQGVSLEDHQTLLLAGQGHNYTWLDGGWREAATAARDEGIAFNGSTGWSVSRTAALCIAPGGSQRYDWAAGWVDAGATPATDRLTLIGDTRRGVDVLLGSNGAVWEWDGGWVDTGHAVPGGGWGAAAWDPSRQRVVLLQTGTGQQPAMWDYDGATWTQQQPGQLPRLSTATGLVFDPRTQRLTYFQGGAVWLYLP